MLCILHVIYILQNSTFVMFEITNHQCSFKQLLFLWSA